MARRLLNLYIKVSTSHPKLAATGTALALASTGDIVAQKGVESRESIDWRRTGALAIASAGYAAYIYVPFLRISTTVLGEGTARSILAKTAIDNFVLSPFIYMPWFYLSTEWMQGRGLQSGLERLRTRFMPSLYPLWSMWVPAQIINFWFVPIQLRIAFLYSVESAWSVVISIVSQVAPESLPAPTPVKEAALAQVVEAQAEAEAAAEGESTQGATSA